jgi:nitrogen fixation-related uncharacterized protein
MMSPLSLLAPLTLPYGHAQRMFEVTRSTRMAILYVTIWGFALLAGFSSVMALVWALQNGQLGGTRRDAASIFALDDTVGSAPEAPRAGLSTRGE